MLCLNVIHQQFQKRNNQRALEVTYWDPRDKVSPNPLKFVNSNFTKIWLTGSREDQRKLAYAQLAIRKLLHQPDRTLGIEFILTDNAKYSSLVQLFNLCEVEGADSYVHYKNKFWVFNLWPHKPKPWRNDNSSILRRVSRPGDSAASARCYHAVEHLMYK